tara:strand:+ start:14402 stop:15235 length:834 start_codon:yes stop_codon:yes gene_type:complete
VAFLKLNNYLVPVAAESVSIQRSSIGRTGRSYGGTYTSAEKYSKRTISGSTTPMSYADAMATEGLILGRGHSFSFNEGMYSSRGLGPNRSYASIWHPTGGEDNGPYLETKGTTLELEWRIPSMFSGDWCVSFFYYDAAIPEWQGWAALGNGAATQKFYRWGTGYSGLQGSTAAFDSEFAVDSAGYFTCATDSKIDDMQFFPYHPTVNMLESWKDVRTAGTHTNPFSPLPNLYLSGDCVPEDQIEVFGTVTAIDYVQGAIDGSFQSNLITLEFTLEEV